MEFETKIIQQISGRAIGTKFAPPYACLIMDRIENKFLYSEIVKPWLWLRHIDDIFFIWTECEDKLEGFLNRLINFHPNLRFTHQKSKFSDNFLDVSVSIVDNNLKQIYFVNPRLAISFLILTLAINFTTKSQLFTARDFVSKSCAHLH